MKQEEQNYSEAKEAFLKEIKFISALDVLEEQKFYNQKQKYFKYNLKRILWVHIIGIIISVYLIYCHYSETYGQIIYNVLFVVTAFFCGITLFAVAKVKYKVYIKDRDYWNVYDFATQKNTDKTVCIFYALALTSFIFLVCANPFIQMTNMFEANTSVDISLFQYIKFLFTFIISLSTILVSFPLAFRDYSGDVIGDYKEQWENEQQDNE